MDQEPALGFESAEAIFLGLGLAFLAAAVLPRFLHRSPVSLPMIYVACGMLLGLPWVGSLRADPILHGELTEHLCELAVIVSLMSAGLKLDRPLGLRTWGSTWRLLLVTMPLCIAALAAGGVWLLGLPLAAAIMLGAVIAPTDPVLASSVQVAPPGEGDQHEARFALTSEAGLNDGLAFPFVNLALVVAATGLARDGLADWMLVDVLWQICAGVVVGAVVGHLVAVLVFRYCPDYAGIDGFVAIALTFVAYGITEIAHGYGFIGVFIAALMFRRYERDHVYQKELHAFSEQVERLLMAAILILFGASIPYGLFEALTLPGIMLGLLFVLVIRPTTGLLAMMGRKVHRKFKHVIAVYGIRGIGTFYYLAYGLNHSNIGGAEADVLWAVAGFIVLISVVFHGTTAPRAMREIGGAEADV